MSRRGINGVLVLFFISLASVAFAGPTAADLPGVPLSRVKAPLKKAAEITKNKQAVQTPSDRKKQATTEERLKSLRRRLRGKTDESTSVLLAMKPGENLVVPIAIKHPNRILTPYDNAKVFTTRTDEVKTDGSIIYVTPAKAGPLTMFITDRDGDQSVSLSLTLVPTAIPPKEVKLVFSATTAGGVLLSGNKKEARRFEHRNSHFDQINKVMLALAKQEIPHGYSLRTPSFQDQKIVCDIPGVTIRTAQMLDGFSLKASVSVLSNPTDIPIQIRESACWQNGVMGVATWPSVEFLQSGESVELYVLFEAQQKSLSTTKARPALLTHNSGEVQ